MKEIEERRSIRRYKPIKIESQKLDAVLESARMAPSGNNKQPWHFIVVTDQSKKESLVEVANNQRWMLDAPVFIVCVADIRARVDSLDDIYVDEETSLYELKRVIRDTAIAIGHMQLEATHQGLGTCWVGWFTQKIIRPILGIPSDKYVVGIITLGYADENPPPRQRKAIQEIVHRETW
jgi:nitroreductase